MLKKILVTFLLFSIYTIINPISDAAAVACCSGEYPYFNPLANRCNRVVAGVVDFVSYQDTLCTGGLICDFNTGTLAIVDDAGRGNPYYSNSQCVQRGTLNQTGTDGFSGPNDIKAAGGKYCKANEVPTVLGCIDFSPAGFATQFIRIGIGIGSGIAFLMIMLGSFKIATSQGMPDHINAGKETLTSAIVGLIFIVLTVTIIQIVGFDILGLGALGLGSR